MSTETTQVKTGDVRVRVIQDSDPTDPREDDNVGTMVCWHSKYNLGDYENYDHNNNKNPYADSAELFRHILRETEAGDEALKDIMKVLLAEEGAAKDYKGWNKDGEEDGSDLDFIDWQLQYGAGQEEDRELLEAARQVATILPLNLFDHSGITMSTGGFSCPFDSGQVGWIYATHKKVKEEGIVVEDMEKHLDQEVKTYAMFLENQIYGFKIEAAEVCPHCEDVVWEEAEDGSCWGFYGTGFDNGMAEHMDEELHDKLKEALANPEYGG
jgi:hypothetical protein